MRPLDRSPACEGDEGVQLVGLGDRDLVALLHEGELSYALAEPDDSHDELVDEPPPGWARSDR